VRRRNRNHIPTWADHAFPALPAPETLCSSEQNSSATREEHEFLHKYLKLADIVLAIRPHPHGKIA